MREKKDRKQRSVKTLVNFAVLCLFVLSLAALPAFAQTAPTATLVTSSKALNVGGTQAKAATVDDHAEIFDFTKAQDLYPNSTVLSKKTLAASNNDDPIKVGDRIVFEWTLSGITEGSPLTQGLIRDVFKIVGTSDPAKNIDPDFFPFHDTLRDPLGRGSITVGEVGKSFSEPLDVASASFEAGKEYNIYLPIDAEAENFTPTTSLEDQAPVESVVSISPVLLAWNGAPDAISKIQHATVGKGYNYYSIKAEESIVDEDARNYTLDPPIEGKEVNFVQMVNMTTALANDESALNNDEVLILKMSYNVGELAEMKTFKDVSLENAFTDATIKPTPFAKGQTTKEISALEDGEWAAFVAGNTTNPEALDAKLDDPVYDIYFARAVQPKAGSILTRIVTPESKKIYPAENYVATKTHQADPNADYVVYLAKTDYGTDSQDVGVLDYGFVPNTYSPTGPVNGRESISLVTDATGVTDAQFVTYKVDFKVPNFTQYLNLEARVEDVKVVAYGDDKTNYVLQDAKRATAAGQYWVENTDFPDPGTPQAKDKVLDADTTYTVYYTVAIDQTNKKATSNVAVLTKTAQIANGASSDSSRPRIDALGLRDYGQPGFTGGAPTVTARDKDSGLHIVKASASADYKAANDNITYESVSGNAGPIQSFAYKGFGVGDTFIFTRDFTYALPADGQTEYVSDDTLRLEKYANETYSTRFELIDTPALEDITASTIDSYNGKFWAVKHVKDDIDVKKGDPFEVGGYSIYYVITDNGDGGFDLDPADGVIADPNGLYAQPSNSSNSSSGCSVGATSAYDMALLALFALGLVVLRVRSRKS